jgi:hypothetical protein
MPLLVHRIHRLLRIWIPVLRILLRIRRHHGTHVLLGIVRLLVARMPHMWRHRGVGAIMPSRRRLHGHRLPIRHVVWIHVEVWLFGATARWSQTW